MQKITFIIVLFFLNSLFAATGFEEGSKPKKENYLYNPLNYMNTHVFIGGTYFSISGDSEADAKPGLQLGVQAEAGEKLAYLIGVKYQILKSEIEISNVSNSIQLDYLSLILGAKFYFSGSSNGFFIRGNIDPSLLVSSSTSNSNTDFKDFNLFAQIGIGYTFPGSSQFVIDLGYNHGLLDITKASSDDSSIQGLSLNLGLLF